MSSAEDARVACGIAASGAEKLTGRGDFLAVAEGSTTHFQAAHVPPADFNEFRAAFRNPVALWNADS